MVCGEKYSVALCILFIQFPCETVFGIFHFKAKSSQLITDFIACSPVFIGFGFHTLFQQHIYYFAVCLFTCLVIGGFFFQAQDFVHKEMEHTFQFFQIFCGNSGFLVQNRINHTGAVKQMGNDNR